jgi:hypothetical protein
MLWNLGPLKAHERTRKTFCLVGSAECGGVLFRRCGITWEALSGILVWQPKYKPVQSGRFGEVGAKAFGRYGRSPKASVELIQGGT